MKLSQAVKLGHQNISGYKRRNLSTIIIIGIIFGLLAGIIFLVQGAENLIFRAANETLGEPYYLTVRANMSSLQYCKRVPIPDYEDAYQMICDDSLRESAIASIENYDAEIISSSHNINYTIGTPENYTNLIKADLSKLPEDAIAVLVSPELLNEDPYSDPTIFQRAELVQNITTEKVGTMVDSLRGQPGNWYIAGVLPSGRITHFYQGNIFSANPMDLTLDLLGMNTGGGSLIYLETENTFAKDWLENLRQEALEPDDGMFVLSLKFPNRTIAETYLRKEVCTSLSYNCEKTVTQMSNFDNRVDLERNSKITWASIKVIETVASILAIIIIFFTFTKVLSDQDRQVNLYKSLGASTGDVILIYGAYLLEVCFWAILFMFVLGLLFAGITSICNLSAFSAMLTAAYGQTFTWPMLAIGWNNDLLLMVSVILLTAAVSLLWFVLAKKISRNHKTKR